MISLQKARNSIICICLTPNPPIGGEHLKIIELGSPSSVPVSRKGRDNGSKVFSEQTQKLKKLPHDAHVDYIERKHRDSE